MQTSCCPGTTTSQGGWETHSETGNLRQVGQMTRLASFGLRFVCFFHSFFNWYYLGSLFFNSTTTNTWHITQRLWRCEEGGRQANGQMTLVALLGPMVHFLFSIFSFRVLLIVSFLYICFTFLTYKNVPHKELCIFPDVSMTMDTNFQLGKPFLSLTCIFFHILCTQLFSM